MKERPLITSFLLNHSEHIETSSLVADSLVVTFKETLSPADVIGLFTDLITHCRPTKAQLIDRYTVRLEWP